MATPTGRDNGLPPASRYIALVDVDPPVADHVLELLRDAGVTAVAEPLSGDRGLARESPPPRRPTERVHVDLGRLRLARDVVGAALPTLRADFHALAARASDEQDAAALVRSTDDLAADEVDTRFADIVAGYHEAGSDPVPRWSVLEDAVADDLPPIEEPERPPLSSRLIRSQPAPPPDDPDDHFVPPEPPPLPETDRITRLAWAGLLGGPAIIVIAALLGIAIEGWVVVASLAAFLGGFATLVLRMADRRSDDDGWDDGAVL